MSHLETKIIQIQITYCTICNPNCIDIKEDTRESCNCSLYTCRRCEKEERKLFGDVSYCIKCEKYLCTDCKEDKFSHITFENYEEGRSVEEYICGYCTGTFELIEKLKN